MSAPDILAEIKEDLGITDGTSDAWLQRRIDAIWARMEVYTSRALCAPPQQFVDDWGLIASDPGHVMPPLLTPRATSSVFLRYFPVASVDSVELEGNTTVTPADVAFDPRTGKLIAINNAIVSEDLGMGLRSSRARITYKAGWDEIPADLYEIVLGAISPLWSLKKAGDAGLGGTVTGINVQDVGSIELSADSSFVANASKSSARDPLLGPYSNMLAEYVDHRSRIGWAGQAVTTTVATP